MVTLAEFSYFSARGCSAVNSKKQVNAVPRKRQFILALECGERQGQDGEISCV